MSRVLRCAPVVVLGVVLLSVGLAAQRGGGGGGGNRGGVERPETPMVFDSEELKVHIEAPDKTLLYTTAAPGRYKSMLVNGKFLHISSMEFRDIAMDAKASPNMTEADLKGYLDALGTNPPQAKLPGFKKVSLKTIKIGKQRDKDAVEFVYNAEQGGTSTTFRQIAFVHAGMGFVFTCSSLQPQFGAADSQVFNPVFAHMEFK